MFKTVLKQFQPINEFIPLGILVTFKSSVKILVAETSAVQNLT